MWWYQVRLKTSLVAQMVKHLSTMRETRVWSLGQEDPLWVRKIWVRRRKWQSTPVLLPGKSHGQRSLVGYSPWGRKESDTTEQLHFTYLGHKGEVLMNRSACMKDPRELLSPFLCFRWADFQPMATFSSVPSVVLRVAYSQLWTRKGAVTTTQPFWNQDLGFRRRQWHPTPVLSPGKSHGQRSLVGCSPWGR